MTPGKIWNSNGPAIVASVLDAGATPIDMGIAADDLESLKRVLFEATRKADLVITTGGASRGDFDFVGEALKQLGVDVFFSKVGEKRGRRLSFGKMAETFFMGLPGNPSAALDCFEVFARPLIRKLAGHASTQKDQ